MSRAGKRVRTPDVVRRQRTRRLDATIALAVLLPLLTVGGLALVRPAPVRDTVQPPALTRLTSALVVCPSAHPGSPRATVSTAGGASGRVSVMSATGERRVAVRRGRASPISGSGALVVRGSGPLAPGLAALRSGLAPLSGLDCPNPASDQWFSGLGARADHDSVIELVNPDPGPATVDVTLYGNHRFSARRLHGIKIPGHKTVSLDLGKLVPRRPVLTAHLTVSQGRLAVNVLDSVTDLLSRRTQREWVPRQLLPSTDNQLLGLPAGAGARTLVMANPTPDVVRAQVKIVTGDTSFAPAGMGPVPLPPGATTTVDLTRVLAKALDDGAVGVEVESTGAITTSLTTALGGDQAMTVPDATFTQEAATLVPVTVGRGARKSPVRARLLLSADRAGAARVTAYDATGKPVLRRTFAEQQGRTVAVRLPRGTAFVRVVPQRTPLRAVVVVSGDGATVIPLHEILEKGLVPQISPGQD
jgi:hypothetical protein